MTPPSLDAPRPRLGVRLGKRLLRRLDRFQADHSLISTTPFIDNSEVPQTVPLENNYPTILAELNVVMGRLDQVPAFHQLSPDQVRISKGDNWKTFAFYVFGERVNDNCRACPATAAVLDTLPGLQNAWFSILAPRYHIPPHRGPTRSVVRCHLGLLIPDDAASCWIRVDDQTRAWTAGACLCFDDTYEHEVRNNTDQPRVVLFVDFDRPMDAVGRRATDLLLAVMRSSAYVRRPLKNLARWNREHRVD